MTKVYNQTTQKARRRTLRKNLPNAEVILWSRLTSRQMLGVKFRRQYSVGSYIIDFYSPEIKLAIEVDGDSHFEHQAIKYDRERQSFIENFGIQFLRFTNIDIYKNLHGVLEEIYETVKSKKDK